MDLLLASLEHPLLTAGFPRPQSTHLGMLWKAGPSNRAAALSPGLRRLFLVLSTPLEQILAMGTVLVHLDMVLPLLGVRRTLLRPTPAVRLR